MWRGAAAVPEQDGGDGKGFIRVQGGRFVDGACREFLFSGWNGWRLVDSALNNPSYITDKFGAAQRANLNVMRFFIGDDDGGPVLQTAPGKFDERVARALDFLLAEAAAHGIRLTVVLLNQWKKNNGIPQFEQWCGTAGSNAQPRPDIDPRKGLSSGERLQTPYNWLTSSACRQQVKDYLTALVNRENTLTGLRYKDDPTILSWNLLNEPRCRFCGPEAVDSWIGEMAAHLKSVDPNHMITTGAEGFYDESDPAAGFNPQDPATQWASRSGQNFRANHAHAAIDYATIHLWPDNWRKPSPPFDVSWGRKWIEAHSQAARSLGKPLVLEEFGKEARESEITAVRDPWFRMVNDATEQSLAAGGPLRAAMFWQWDGEDSSRSGAGNSIRQSDTTFQNDILPFARKLASMTGAPVPGCTLATPTSTTSSPGGGTDPGQVQSFASSAGRRLRASG